MFPRSAVQAIYRYSKGIPRRINIVCDRTLLTAFGLNKRQITAKIARSAIREISGKSRITLAGLFEENRELLIFSTLCTALIFLLIYPPDIFKRQTTIPSVKPSAAGTRAPVIKIPPLPPAFSDQKGVAETEPALPEPITALTSMGSIDTDIAATEKINTDPSPEVVTDSDLLKPAMLSKPVESEQPPETPEALEKESKSTAILPVRDFADWLLTRRTQITRKDAITSALHRWKEDVDIVPHLDGIDDNQMFFRMAAQHNGFKCQTVTNDLELIRKLNLPAVVELMMPDGSSMAYMAVQHMDAERATLAADGIDPVVVNLRQLKTFWTGAASVPWKNFLSCAGVIPLYAPGDSVVTLKIMLTDMGFSDIIVNSNYDDITQQVVKKIQARNGILPDGVVGPLTKIILYNEHGAFNIPHILTD
jgi:general secretion pathway protein A